MLNYKFADFTFCVDEESLYKAGARVKMRIRTAQVLRVLVEGQGRIIGKEEFFEKVWRDACVEDNNLTVAVAQLRRVLGETEDNKFIETVPRKGYRFTAPVEKASDNNANTEVILPETAIKVPEEFEIQPVREIGKSQVGIFARSASRKVLGFATLAVILFSVVGFWQRSASMTQAEPLCAIAVMPFSDITTSGDNGFYAEELTQDLTYNLARVSNLQVSAYDAVTAFDAANVNSNIDLAKFKDTLKIDAAITGKIQRDKNRINFAVELKDLRSGASVWERSYSFDKHDLPAASYRIACDLAPQPGNRKQFGNTSPVTNNYEAYQAYLVARHHSVKRSLRDNRKTIEDFTLATTKDPSFADAHSGLAIAHIQHGLHLYSTYGLGVLSQAFPIANEQARRALQLNPACDEALTALAFLNYRYEYDWVNAENNFTRAIEINPNNVLAHRWYGEFLHTRGRFDEGFANQKIALALEPNSPRILNEIAWGNYLAGRFDEAVSYSKAANAIDRTYSIAMYNSSEIYELKGDYEAAASTWKEAMMLEHVNHQRIADIEGSFLKHGYQGFIRAKIAWLESMIEEDNVFSMDLARSYAALGNKDKAVEWLRKSVSARVPDVMSIRYAPAFDTLRDDMRFRALVKQMNFPE